MYLDLSHCTTAKQVQATPAAAGWLSEKTNPAAPLNFRCSAHEAFTDSLALAVCVPSHSNVATLSCCNCCPCQPKAAIPFVKVELVDTDIHFQALTLPSLVTIVSRQAPDMPQPAGDQHTALMVLGLMIAVPASATHARPNETLSSCCLGLQPSCTGLSAVSIEMKALGPVMSAGEAITTV